MAMLRDYALHRGLPQALYVDRAGIYRSDREPKPDEIMAGEESPTQFTRHMDKLGVEGIWRAVRKRRDAWSA